MKNIWSRSVFPIAALFSFRMLGLFMLIPVFTIYASKLDGACPRLIGLALGSYGLSQGLLQIPFGMLSDRYGRKPIICLGLSLFAIGSLIAALSHSINWIIFARILQGTGAIGSVLIALLADLTTDEQRTKAMAVIGATIGLSFSVSILLSPAIANHYGLAGIFYVSFILALLGIVLLYFVIPSPRKEPFHAGVEAKTRWFSIVLKNPHLQRLNLGIFCQHAILTSTFFAVPLLLQEHLKQGELSATWHFYLPLLAGSFLLMLPIMFFAEKKQKQKVVFLLSVLITMFGQLLLAYIHFNLLSTFSILFLYFIAFNLLEANLPSMVSKQATAEYKGTAMGIYSSSQFLGIFAGGLMAGFVFQAFSYYGLFMVNALFALLWFCFTFSMNPHAYQTTIKVSCKLKKGLDERLSLLNQLDGVNKVTAVPDEGIVYLLINKETYIKGSAEQILQS